MTNKTKTSQCHIYNRPKIRSSPPWYMGERIRFFLFSGKFKRVYYFWCCSTEGVDFWAYTKEEMHFRTLVGETFSFYFGPRILWLGRRESCHTIFVTPCKTVDIRIEYRVHCRTGLAIKSSQLETSPELERSMVSRTVKS